MNTSKHFRKPSVANDGASKRIFLTAAACATVTSALAAPAAERPYNPDHLGPAQLAHVSAICQTVMGLKPSEPLSSGYWPGNIRLDSDTSHYRGCIVTLSDSLQSETGMQMSERTEHNTAQSATSTPLAAKRAPASGSFFYASPREMNRREESACASLGLEPGNSTFEGCVKSLKDTFYAIDHPVN
jgi:hypothetical protein